jgi:hypothetical protein
VKRCAFRIGITGTRPVMTGEWIALQPPMHRTASADVSYATAGG